MPEALNIPASPRKTGVRPCEGELLRFLRIVDTHELPPDVDAFVGLDGTTAVATVVVILTIVAHWSTTTKEVDKNCSVGAGRERVYVRHLRKHVREVNWMKKDRGRLYSIT